MIPNPPQVLSVTHLNEAIKYALEGTFFYCLVEGELSNIAKPQSGHVYFTLKDQQSAIRCVLWRQSSFNYLSLLENGTKVQIKAKISVYVPRGEYQLVVSHMEPAGIGDLYKAFDILKKKLSLEGLFADVHKQSLKKHPKAIGIISSATGAALQDVRYVLNQERSDIPIIVYPTLVQGAAAKTAIVAAIHTANVENAVEVLLLVRGGGSIEDLWAFNEECVARAIFASHIPIITGIGHETDTTIADYVADKRAPTPSVAAKMAAVSKDELLQYLDQINHRLQDLMLGHYHREQERLKRLHEKLLLVHPLTVLQKYHIRLAYGEKALVAAITQRHKQQRTMLDQRQGSLSIRLLKDRLLKRSQTLAVIKASLVQAIKTKQREKQQVLAYNAGLLQSLSPLKVLSRGYSLTYVLNPENARILVKDVHDLKPGTQVYTRLDAGEIISTVVTVNKL